MSLTDDESSVKTAISAYISIIVEDINDYDLDIHVLDEALERVVEMSHSSVYKKILAEQVDILRVLTILDLDVKMKMKIFSLAMELVTLGDMKEVVLIFKEEIRKTFESDQEDISQYREFLIRTLQCTCTKFPDQYSLDIIDKDGKNKVKNYTEKIRMKRKRYREKDEQNQIIFAEQKDKIARLEEKSMCKICLTKDVEMVFLPCGHLACEFCGHRVSDCHICRKLIQKKHKIFLS